MTMIVAEVGNVHDGSLQDALDYIGAVADAGADAVKFQCHQGNRWTEFPRRYPAHPECSTRQEYLARMMFEPDQWRRLRAKAHRNGLKFIVSCFSVDGVLYLSAADAQPDYWKVPSGEVNNHDMLRAMAATGKTIILSNGLSSDAEHNEAWTLLVEETGGNKAIYRLQCTTKYPTPPEEIGFNIFANRFRGPWGGISDHSGTIWPSLAAATLGAEMVEVHVIWDRRQHRPDTVASITIDELAQLVKGVRFIETMLANPVDKNKLSAELKTGEASKYVNDPREYIDGKPQFD